MICGDRTCDCGITSESLTITGSGSNGDPWVVESNAFAIVTSITHPGSPFMWQHIFETDTGRIKYWDGTNWIWEAGNPPGCNLERQAALTIAHNTPTTVAIDAEIWDTDGFHTGTDGFATIPAGLGGDYLVTARARYVANATGTRNVRPLIANNATPPTQNNVQFAGGFLMENTANNGNVDAEPFRLEAGATVTLQTTQTSGADLDLSSAKLSLTMIRHIPSLT